MGILLKQVSERQWHQLGHMQVCTWFQTDNHASTPPLSFFTAAEASTTNKCCCGSVISADSQFFGETPVGDSVVMVAHHKLHVYTVV